MDLLRSVAVRICPAPRLVVSVRLRGFGRIVWRRVMFKHSVQPFAEAGVGWRCARQGAEELFGGEVRVGHR